eukprot:jgi/Tetstr1/459955/TSEL_000461.t1
MKVIAKKFRGVWHYGVITGVVTEWVLEDYGGATQWRAVFEDGDIVGLLRSEVVEAMAAAQEHPPVDADGEARLVTVHEGDDLSRSGKVTVQSGWVMEDCLHHMETFSILNAGPLLEEARNVVTEEDGPERKAQHWLLDTSIWLAAAGCGMQGRMTEVAVLVSPESLHAAEAAQPHRH